MYKLINEKGVINMKKITLTDKDGNAVLIGQDQVEELEESIDDLGRYVNSSLRNKSDTLYVHQYIIGVNGHEETHVYFEFISHVKEKYTDFYALASFMMSYRLKLYGEMRDDDCYITDGEYGAYMPVCVIEIEPSFISCRGYDVKNQCYLNDVWFGNPDELVFLHSSAIPLRNV
jgi:hypothetical protein